MPDIDIKPSDPQWRSIPGFEGHYEVSITGEVRSLARVVYTAHGRRLQIKQRVLRPNFTGFVYGHVVLRTLDGRPQTWKLHQLVARAFHGLPPFPDACVRHLDGNPRNNHASNLQWGTRSENSYDTVRHGNHHAANRTHCRRRGHEYTPANTYMARDGKGLLYRVCKACQRINDANKRSRKLASKELAA